MSNTKTGIFRPRRGKRSTAISKDIILRRGEVFFEVPETGVGTGAGKLVMGDGTTEYKDLPYFSESGGGPGGGSVNSVNHIFPDAEGNVDLDIVPYAENLIAYDNIKENSEFIFRTSGGTKDIESGEANLNIIYGNCTIENGVITAATPTSFRSILDNQFNKASMILTGYTLSSTGAITESSGSYVCYIHAVGGLLTGYTIYDPNNSIVRVGWNDSIPTSSTTGIIVTSGGEIVSDITNDPTLSILVANTNGYIIVACENIDDLTVHPRWSGIHDTESSSYVQSSITIPVSDVNGSQLPTATYGFPSVNNIRDEINFDQRTYTQRIGYYPYSTTNLGIVVGLEVPYIYDNNSIFYVLPNPVVYNLANTISSNYIVSDIGTEEFLGTVVPVLTSTVYGQNLKDKLRRDVLTISPQTLTSTEKAQVLSNIGAAASGSYVQTSDIVNSLTSTATDAPLSAAMGKELKDNKADLVNGRVPYSQLPESAMEFKGTWNASTNTPTITQGTGTNGDFYVVSVAGTWNNTSFNVNDRILFDGNNSEWIKLVGETVVSGTQGNFLSIGSGGAITDSGSKASDFLTSHQDISGKADKVTNATNGHIASLNAAGNLVDSGKTASDFTYTNGTGISKSGNTFSADFGTGSGKVCQGNDSRLSDARTPTAHNQAASTITAGTLAGRVQANASAMTTLGNAQVRDIIISPTDLTPGTSALATGAIYFVYE